MPIAQFLCFFLAKEKPFLRYIPISRKTLLFQLLSVSAECELLIFRLCFRSDFPAKKRHFPFLSFFFLLGVFSSRYEGEVPKWSCATFFSFLCSQQKRLIFQHFLFFASKKFQKTPQISAWGVLFLFLLGFIPIQKWNET